MPSGLSGRVILAGAVALTGVALSRPASAGHTPPRLAGVPSALEPPVWSRVLPLESEMPLVAEMTAGGGTQFVRYKPTAVWRAADGMYSLADPASQKTQVRPPVEQPTAPLPPIKPSPDDTAPHKPDLAGWNLLPQTVFPPYDDRVRVPPSGYSSTQYPWSANARTSIGCTAEVYGPNVMVTAAHCLKNPGPFGSWLTSGMTVRRAQDGGNVPFASCSIQNAGVLANWTQSAQPSPYEQYDLGYFSTSGCTVPGTYGNGWYPLAVVNVNQSYYGWVGGYPTDAGNPASNVVGQQWESFDVIQSISSYANRYLIDTSGGTSGGWNTVFCSSYGWYICQIGVHSASGSSYNYGHKFNQAEINALAAFRSANGGP
jgi:V8-like Glu-specific endopeptidase